MKYLVHWKGFTVKNNMCENEENLENIKKLVNKFEERLEAEVK